jgi:hypothetical protein
MPDDEKVTPEAILEFHRRYSFKILEIEDIPKNLSKSLKSANSLEKWQIAINREIKRVLFLFSISKSSFPII